MPISFSRSAGAVEKMCKLLKVSSSGYYYWRKHPVGIRQLKQAQLLDDIRQVHAQSESRYGSPRIADELRERGVKTSRNRVARLMHKAAIRSIMYKKYRVQTTDSSHDYPIAKNLLNREFTADKPGQNRSAEAMGVRYYLHSDRRGLVIPDNRVGFGRPKSNRMGIERWPKSCGYERSSLAYGSQKQEYRG